MGYGVVISDKGTFGFETKEGWDEFHRLEDLRRLNEKEYARQYKSEKAHYVFHGGCLGCVTSLHYGLGNCLGCSYFGEGSNKIGRAHV